MKRSRPSLDYPNKLDSITWKEYNSQHDGDPPPAGTVTKTVSTTGEPSGFVEFLLFNRAKIKDARLVENDTECTCSRCSSLIVSNENHLRLKLEEQDDVVLVCKTCFS